jgi:phosphoribosylaminoimidazole-succinocarboxamide synthase
MTRKHCAIKLRFHRCPTPPTNYGASVTRYRILSQSAATPGKVRDISQIKIGDLHADREFSALAMIATDRVSVYDQVLPTLCVNKGKILTCISNFWFDYFHANVRGHILNVPPSEMSSIGERDRLTLVRPLQMIPLECVARGYLTGSAWREYCRYGTIGGVRYRPGLTEYDQLPEPTFTVARKFTGVRDENISNTEAVEKFGQRLMRRLIELTLMIYSEAHAYALRRGLTLLDTKIEFGEAEGDLYVADELLTPDSSRYALGVSDGARRDPKNILDRSPIKDYLDAREWSEGDPMPSVPNFTMRDVSTRYNVVHDRLIPATASHTHRPWGRIAADSRFSS